MQKFFLVIDTETSGLPKNWKSSYSESNNWPHIIQMAWIIYDSNLIEVKRENHYFKNDGFEMDKTSFKIHKITTEFLEINGENSKDIMLLLYADLVNFKPLVVGHFIEFDYHMLNVEFYRIGKENVLAEIRFFCTMKASAPYVKNPAVTELKLDQFYKELFEVEPTDLHNALFDALNTAKIFFYLLNKDQVIDEYYYTTLPIKVGENSKKRFTIKNLFRLF